MPLKENITKGSAAYHVFGWPVQQTNAFILHPWDQFCRPNHEMQICQILFAQRRKTASVYLP